MEKLTGEQIINILSKVFSEANDSAMINFVYYDEPIFENIYFTDCDEELNNKLRIEFDKLGKIIQVAQEETTDGDAYTVYHFIDHSVFIKIQGCYNSYESLAEYEDYKFIQVFPKEVLRTIYTNN